MPTVQATYDDIRVDYDDPNCTFDGLLTISTIEQEQTTTIKRRRYKKVFTVFEGTLLGTAVYSKQLKRTLLGTVLHLSLLEIPILGTILKFVFNKRDVVGIRAFESTNDYKIFGIKQIFNGNMVVVNGTKKLFTDAKTQIQGIKKIKQTDIRLGVLTPIYNIVVGNTVLQAKYTETKLSLLGTKTVETCGKLFVIGKRSLRHILEALDI